MTYHMFEEHKESDYQASSADLKAMLLSHKIWDAVHEQRLSKTSFANLMGVQPSIVTRWLSGKHNFTIETLFEIEERLNVKLLAIEPPPKHTISLHLKVNNNCTSFDDSKMFQDLTYLKFEEDQVEKTNFDFVDDLEPYLMELRNGINRNEK